MLIEQKIERQKEKEEKRNIEMFNCNAAALLISSFNSLAKISIRKVLRSIKASTTEKGREKFGLHHDYITTNKGIKQNIASLEKALLDNDSTAIHNVNEANKHSMEIQERIADMLDYTDETLSPLINASTQVFKYLLDSEETKCDDVDLLADAVTMISVCSINEQIFDFFAHSAYPFMNKNPAFSFLRMSKIRLNACKMLDKVKFFNAAGEKLTINYHTLLHDKTIKFINGDLIRMILNSQFMDEMQCKANRMDTQFRKGRISLSPFLASTTLPLDAYISRYRKFNVEKFIDKYITYDDEENRPCG